MFKVIFNIIIVAIIIVFALFNQDDMVLNFANLYEIILPKFFVVICAFVIGFVTAVSVFSLKLFTLKFRLRNVSNKYKAAQLRLNSAGLTEMGIKQQVLKLFRAK